MLQIEQIKPPLSRVRLLGVFVRLLVLAPERERRLAAPFLPPTVVVGAVCSSGLETAEESKVSPPFPGRTSVRSTRVRMGAQQEGVHLCGLSASGTSGEHLGSHQMVQLPAAVSGSSPRPPKAAELRLSMILLALVGLTPQLVPSAPSPSVGTVLASPRPKCSQPYMGMAPRAEVLWGAELSVHKVAPAGLHLI